MTRSVAVLADVHGNVAALDAVLADVEKQGVDEVVLAGDYAFFGHRVREAVDRLRDLGAPAILGNTDEYLLGRHRNWIGTPLHQWTRERLGEDHLAWMGGLGFHHRVPAPDGGGDLLVVHANPTNTESLLIMERDPAGTHKLTTERAARKLIGDAQAALLVYGHIHYASAGRIGSMALASIGAVGMPFDGDHRAAYAIVRWDEGWRVEHRRVAYDHEAAAAEIEASGTQHAGSRAARIRRAWPVPFE